MEMMWDYKYMYFLPLATLLTVLIVYCCIMMVRYWWRKAALKKKIKAKKDECRESLENLASGLRVTDGQSQKSKILDLPMEKLLAKLISCEYDAVDVLREYQQKVTLSYNGYYGVHFALEVNAEFNCVVEPIKEAEDLAIECDNMRNSKVQHQRPLHGIPVSLKECYFLKGYDCTAGMSDYIGKPCKEDAVIVQVLKKQGAVPFVRTNIPQTMMTYECSNPIYGQTLNPHDQTRGPGGSSGGEGCIIGAKGSLLGFGSDIGGSIRIPCHMCGVCGLKPTYRRLSVKGTHELGQGQTLSWFSAHIVVLQGMYVFSGRINNPEVRADFLAQQFTKHPDEMLPGLIFKLVCQMIRWNEVIIAVNAAVGPMARDVTSLVIAMKALLCDDMFDLDPTVPPIPFRTEIYEKTNELKIGYYTFDGYLEPVPACQRGVMDAKAILERQGHKLIPFQVPDMKNVFTELYMRITFGDNVQMLGECLRDDIIDPTISLAVTNWSLPKFVQWLMSWVVSYVNNDDFVGKGMRSTCKIQNVYDWWKLAERLQEYKVKFLSLWRSQELDALICPGFAFPAVPNGAVFNVLGGVTYTTLYNLLDYPAGTVPVTKVTREDEAGMKDYPTRTRYERFIKKYFSEGTVDLPVGVQCVGLPYQEELVLRVMKMLENEDDCHRYD